MARRKAMEHELIERIASLLRESGFRNVVRRKSSISETLAAEREGTNVVVHITEAMTAPTATAVPHSMAPKDLDILMKATMPGLTGAPGMDTLRTMRQGSGGGSQSR
jgi:CheY-like chemotaxis protein